MPAKIQRQRRGTGTRRVTVTVPEDVLNEIDVTADLEGSSRSLVMSDLLENALEQGKVSPNA